MPLPELFLQRLKKIIPPEKWDEVLGSFSAPKPVTFRVNVLKASPEEVCRKLESAGFRAIPLSWCPGSFALSEGTMRALQSTDCYRSGEIYVQSLSSMVPALVLDPRPGETVLDIAAAPGSKTTQIAALMQGKGRLVANDSNRGRFFKLKAVVELYGARNVEISLKPGERFGRESPETFDRVLVDAQCSSEARFDPENPRSFGFWKLLKVREMSRKQKRLLLSGFLALKPGGVLVYSTCTFAPEENEAVLDWAAGKLAGHFEIEKIDLPVPNRMPGLWDWGEKKFQPGVRNSVRILPDDRMEGFFVAKIRKR